MIFPVLFVGKGSTKRLIYSSERPSTSTLSGSSSTSFEELFTWCFGKDPISACIMKFTGPKYNLTDLIDIFGRDDSFNQTLTVMECETVEAVAASMMSNILKSHKGLKVELTQNRLITEYNRLQLPGISSAMKPDVSITNTEGDKIVFIEVLSDTLVKTIKKLFFVLLLQLVYIRSVHKQTQEVSGFILPKSSKSDYMVLATVRWDAKHFGFKGEVSPVCKDTLRDCLLKTIMKQRDCVVIPKSEEKIFLSDSLSSHDIVTYLQDDAFESAAFVSCLSIVFYMPSEKIYKMPLDATARETLTTFLLTAIRKVNPEPAQVLLPEDRNQGFFIFACLQPPLDIKSLQLCFDSFAMSVLHAVEEIHELGYVHLDLRVPNICFSNNNGCWQAVLIDLDHCREITRDPTGVRNDNSFMYNVDFSQLEHYDWRHFAIMLARIMEGSDDQYHKRRPKFSDDVCGKELQRSFSYGMKPRKQYLTWNKEKTLDDMF